MWKQQAITQHHNSKTEGGSLNIIPVWLTDWTDDNSLGCPPENYLFYKSSASLKLCVRHLWFRILCLVTAQTIFMAIIISISHVLWKKRAQFKESSVPQICRDNFRSHQINTTWVPASFFVLVLSLRCLSLSHPSVSCQLLLGFIAVHL